MPRLALGIEYFGAPFCGWQRQKDCQGVQAHVETALSRIACEPIEVFCAGRTDRGVHALGQVVHFDTLAIRPDEAWVRGVNSHLPAGVRVQWVQAVGEDFHARFSAIARRYRYVIHNRAVRPGIFHSHQAWEIRPLDAERMHQSAQALLGQHDFSAFRAAECQAKHPVRTLSDIAVQRVGDLVLVDVEANAFLHHMVRNMVGSLLVIGRGDAGIDWMAELLAARDRTRAAPTAEAQGLYLTRVRYAPPYDHFPTADVQGVLWQ